MARANLLMVLHAHLPFVRSPEHPRFLEENWYFEAMTESYIPMLQLLSRNAEKGIPGALNLSLSPTLMHMFADAMLQERYSLHLVQLLELADREVIRFEGDPDKQQLASFYRDRLRSVRHAWENRFNRDILSMIRQLRDLGKLEVLTCVGTHPFLPAYQAEKNAIRFQLSLTVQTCQDLLGFVPKGVWLPECGYFEGLDLLVSEFGFEYCFLETHGVLLANPPPRYGIFEPIQTPSGLLCFGRDQASSREVWSRKVGYPGHPDYREFFKDLAHEMPKEYLGDYFYAAECPIETGFKYHRITGSDQKEIYQPYRALQLAREHARAFVSNREAQVEDLSPHMEAVPCILAPYDAELFGHWWFEGPEFLEAVFERAAWSKSLQLSTVGDALKDFKADQVRQPAFSSWGEGGYGNVWINPEVDWVYPLFYEMLGQFRDCFRKYRTGGFTGRALAQMAREMVLLQSSDWAFMIHNKSSESYARARVQEHYSNFQQLRKLLSSGRTQSRFLVNLEQKHNLFSWMGPAQYRLLSQ
jgi:1,4-alpha-glucan branching enzyme